MTHPYRLMAPGPVPLAPEVLKALSEPMIHHRTPEFDQILSRVLKALPDVFQTHQRVFVQSCTGSGGMESALVNCLSHNDEIAVVVSGKFGERWAKMADAYGLIVHSLNVDWGHAVDIRQFEAFLNAHPRVRAVLTQACETSTATLHPVREMSEITRQIVPEALVMVDAITALGATPLSMDEWKLDVVIAGSQKAFMIPTGLSLISLSQRAWQAAQSARLPRFYLDLRKEQTSNQKGETFFSSNVALIKALDRVLPRLTGANRLGQIARCDGLATMTRKMAERYLGLATYSKSPSPSVTALVVPSQIDGTLVRKNLEAKYNVTVMDGQDHLKGKILRIGHLGYITDDDAVQTLVLLGKTLCDLNYNIPLDDLGALEREGRDLLKATPMP